MVEGFIFQMVPVTGSTTGSATGSTDEKRQKPYQLVQRGESWETAEGKQTDRPEQQQQQQQEVRSRCVTPEEVSDEAAIVQVEAIHGVFVKKGSCPFYLLKDRRNFCFCYITSFQISNPYHRNKLNFF